MSTFLHWKPGWREGDLQRLIGFKYYIVLKWRSRFRLGLDAAKRIRIMWENTLNKKLLNIEFHIKPNSSTLVGDRRMHPAPTDFFVRNSTLNNIIWSSFWYNAFFLERDRHMRLWTFLYAIQCSTTFIWSIFLYTAYFWQRRALKWIYFPIFVRTYNRVLLLQHWSQGRHHETSQQNVTQVPPFVYIWVGTRVGKRNHKTSAFSFCLQFS